MSDINNFEEILSHNCFTYYLFFVSFSWYSVTTFEVFLQFWGILFCIFHFYFCFSVLEVYITICSSLEILSSVIFSLLINLLRGILHFCYSVFDLQHFFKIFFCLSYPYFFHICFLFIKALSILIIFVLNSQSDNPTCLAYLILVLMLVNSLQTAFCLLVYLIIFC